MRRLLLHHLINGRCVPGSADAQAGCQLWQTNFFPSFDDADDKAPILSIIFSSRLVSVTLLRRILDVLGVPPSDQLSCEVLYQSLRSHILSLW